MTKPKKILPPPELSARVVPRDDEQVAIADSRRSDIQAAVIRWRDLVLATWQLADDKKYRGRLPEGLSSQQFWAKVTRAAGRLGGKVGVAVRGREWWVWSVRRPHKETDKCTHTQT